jgi:serine/threonine-protein kinase
VARLPPELDDLIFRLMAKNPDERPQTADEVRERLLPILEKLGTEAGAAGTKGPRPSMSGEFVVRAARASGARAAEQLSRADTDDALPPAPKEAPTDDALPPARSNTRWIVAGALSVLVIGASIALLATSSEPPPQVEAGALPAPSEPKPLEVKAAEVKPPDAVTPSEVKPEPTNDPKDEAKDEAKDDPKDEAKLAEATPAELPDDELEDLAPIPNGPKKRVVREVKAPTEQELKKRLASLEARLRKATESGASPNPAALQYLAKYRVQATMADTAAQRGKLARQLDQWERLFLSR